MRAVADAQTLIASLLLIKNSMEKPEA
jgi:hypothetical protein